VRSPHKAAIRMSGRGTKRTSVLADPTSAFDPERTFEDLPIV